MWCEGDTLLLQVGRQRGVKESSRPRGAGEDHSAYVFGLFPSRDTVTVSWGIQIVSPGSSQERELTVHFGACFQTALSLLLRALNKQSPGDKGI